jgi:diguanylate cyclase (GGDEF)-like protein
MRLLRQWWNTPADYTWTIAYHRSNPILRHAHIAVGTWCWLYAVLCIFLAHTPAGIPDSQGRVFVLVLAAANAVLGVVWVRGPWPTKTLSRLFVLYVEVSAGAALLMLSDPDVALAFASALGVIGSYVATYHSPKMYLAHQMCAIVLVTIVFVRAITAPGADVVLACAYLILLILVLFSAPVLLQVLLLCLRRDAASAFYDPLTGLRNRRGLRAAITEHGDQPGPATVMVIDLDNFKRVNDRFGHNHGDVVLRAVANEIHAILVPPAITARSGGEEFVVLTHIDPSEAIEHANALRARFTSHAGVGATVSIGVAHFDADTLTTGFEQACHRADAAMYAAKRAGEDTVRIAEVDARP